MRPTPKVPPDCQHCSTPHHTSPALQIGFVKGLDIADQEVAEAQRRYQEMVKSSRAGRGGTSPT